jgi:peptidoglycan/xylan/chitin deacetylase (PgdA/CDA1 family)
MNAKSNKFTACITVDVEQDCPPYMSTYRGIEEGLPKLLAFLTTVGIRGTFFSTGDVAERFPDAIRTLVNAGHELGCHGYSHRRFDSMNYKEAEQEIEQATSLLRTFYPVTSFRAPNLSFRTEYLALLEKRDYQVDSSQAKYKPSYWRRRRGATSLRRVPASITSSVLRLPLWTRRIVLRCLAEPAVLFVHPWEFVDWRKTRLRWDCRFRTGDQALECLATSIELLRKRGAKFSKLEDFAQVPLAERELTAQPG